MNIKNLNSRNLSALTAMLMLTVTAAQGQSAFTNALMNLSPGPVAYWPLQETTQPPASYVETNLGSLGPIGNAYYASTNVIGQYQAQGFPFGGGIPGDNNNVGVNFAGNPDAFMIVPTTSSSVSLQPGHAFTVEAWIFPNNSSEIAGIISQTGPALEGGANESTNSAGWSLNLNYMPRFGTNSLSTNSLMGFSFHVFNGIGSGGAEADAGNVYASNNWYHVVGVFDGVNCTLYIDGTNDTSWATPIDGSFLPDTWDPIMFGVSHALDANGAGTPYPPYAFNGGMADVAIYTNALSAAQIANDYNDGENGGYTNYVLSQSGNPPAMFWQMGAPQYTVPPTNTYPSAANLGSDNDPNIAGLYQPGTLPGVPGPQYSGMGSDTNACAFNGLNSGVMVWTNNNQLSSPLNATNQSISLLCWFKGNPADAEQRYQGLVSRGDNGWRLSLDQSGHIHWTFSAGSDLVSTYPYNDGNWHFVVGVYTNTGAKGPGGFGWAATNYLYIDGRLDNSVLITNVATAAITNLGLVIGGDANFIVTNLGAVSPGYYPLQRYFAGRLAQVAYFTNALTATQVLNLYTNADPQQVPYIVAQPTTGRTQTGGTGTFVFFGVVANGAPSLSYQWFFNTSSNYSGATALANDNNHYYNEQTFNMTVSNLVNGESGYYYVVVTNNYGSVTSALATLSVVASPVITSQSPSGPFNLFTNQSATLSVTATGPATLAYQWFTNGVADATAGKSSTYIASAQHAASGETYYCTVSDTYGSTNSVTSTLTVLTLPPSILTSPYGSNVIAFGASGYWPMHEKETQPLLGDVETNYGTFGFGGDGFYQDWAQPTVTHGSSGAIAGDTDGSVTFYDINNDALVVPHNSPQLTIGASQSQFALEAWVKPLADNNNGIGSYMVVMGQGAVGNNGLNNSANESGFALQYGGTPSTFSMVVQDGAGGSNFEQKTFPEFPPGQWYHVVCYWSGTSYTFYINGQPAGLEPPNGNETGNPMNADVCGPLTIGGGRWGSTGMSHPFIGSIDEVAVYTNITSQNQAQTLEANDYAAGSSTSSNYFQTVTNNQPLLYYRMDAPTYTQPPYSAMTAVLTNYGSVGLNGVYVPSAIPGSAMGPASGAGTLSTALTGTNAMAGNGIMSFADGGIAPQFDPVTTNAFSYSLWAKGYPCDERNYNEMFCGNDSTWRSAINRGGNFQIHGNADIIPSEVVNDGNWHQWVITARPGITNGVWTGNFTNSVYIDGALAVQSINTGTNTPTGNPGPEVTIGTEWGKTNCVTEGNGGRTFAGDLCEAAFFFGTVLTPAQVQSLYNSGDIAPTIVVQPVSGTALITGAFTNSVTANGAQPLYYQWYTNGIAIGSTATNISGMITNGVISPITTEQLIVNPVEMADVGNYYVVVSNAYGSATSSIVTLSGISTPIITNQAPITYTNPFTVYAGVNPTFSVTALGAPPLSYFWMTNGVLDTAAGTASSSFIFSNVQSAFTNYCVVSNQFGTVQSLVWSAQVIPDPTAPYLQAVLAADPADFWTMNDTNLDGLDNGQGDGGYVVNDYVSGNNGLYTNSDLANLTAISSYNTTAGPLQVGADFGNNVDHTPSCANSIWAPDFTMPNGSNAEFTVSAWVYPNAVENGNAGIVAKGLFNQEEIDMDCGGPSNAFRFEVRNAAGTVANANSAVSTENGGVANHWYHLVGVCDEANGLVSFYVNGELTGTAAIQAASGITNSLQTPISFGSRSSDDPAYFFGDDNQQFSGYIQDVAVFRYAMTSSQVAALYSGAGNSAPFFIQTPPGTNTASAGTSMVFSPAVASGSGPLEYWWNLVNNGTIVSNVVTGVTNGSILNAAFTFTNTPEGWNGDVMNLVVSNAYGGTNFPVSLVVITGLTVTVTGPPTTNTYLYNGYSMTYKATALGTHPFYYQWYTNGIAVPNATSANFTLAAQVGLTSAVSLITTNAFNGYAAVTNAGIDWLTGVALPTDPYGQAILNLGPFAYWRLNEASGSPVAYDYVGGYNGLYGVNTTNGSPGVSTAYPGFGTQPDLGVFMCNTPPSGYVTNGCVSVPSGLNLNTNNVTFVSWVYLIGSSQNNPSGIMFSRAGTACGDQIGGADDIDYTWDNQSSTYDYGSGIVVPNDSWVMVALAINPNNATLYMLSPNGTSSAVNSVANPANSFAGGPLNLGADENGPTSITRVLNGEMDEAAVFPYTLSESQLQQLFNAAQTSEVNTTPTNIVFSVANNQLTLSWPSDHIGWQLQAETNQLSIGISNNWVNVSGSTTTDQMTFPLNLANGCVFYRLVYQP